MSRLGSTVRVVFGLFVDDGRFAVAILAWLLLVWQLLPRLGAGAVWSDLILFAGLSMLLVGNTARQTRRRHVRSVPPS